MALSSLMAAQANLVAAFNVPAPAGTAAPVFAAALLLASAPAPTPKTEGAPASVAKAPRRQVARAAQPAHAAGVSVADVPTNAPQAPPSMGWNATAVYPPEATALVAPSSIPATPSPDDRTMPVPGEDSAVPSRAAVPAMPALPSPPPPDAATPPADPATPPVDAQPLAASARRRATGSIAAPDATPPIAGLPDAAPSGAGPLAVVITPGVRAVFVAPTLTSPTKPVGGATEPANTSAPPPCSPVPPNPDKPAAALPVAGANTTRPAMPHAAMPGAVSASPALAAPTVAIPLIAAAQEPSPHAAPAASVTATPMPASAVEQVAATVRVSVAGSVQQVTITLAPRELGTVEIHVARQGAGPATVALSVERPETLALLRRDAPTLQSALDRAGVPVAPQHVTMTLATPDVPTLGTGTQGDPRAPSHRPEPPRPVAPQAAAPAVAEPPIEVPAQARAGIDITA